jgi:hypothetical protein
MGKILRGLYIKHTPSRPVKTKNDNPTWWNPNLVALRKQVRTVYKRVLLQRNNPGWALSGHN